jgi:hypothetical protein
MSKQDGTSGWSTSTRGESAWKEAREQVAARNAEVRKTSKATREVHDRRRDDLKRTAGAKRGGNAR